MSHASYRNIQKNMKNFFDSGWPHVMLGNVTALTNRSYNVASLYDMEAFGTVKAGSQEGVHLTTKEYDADTELYYFGARWYDPQTGRWIEKEPLGLDGPNLYWFSLANPIAYFDPNGLSSIYGTFPDDEPTIRTRRRGYGPKKLARRTHPAANACPPEEPCPGPESGFCEDPKWSTEAFHPGASKCFRKVNSNPGIQCCYDGAGGLIPGGIGAGTLDLVPVATGWKPDGECKSGGNVIGHLLFDVSTWSH